MSAAEVTRDHRTPFAYRATRLDGKEERGVIEASNRDEALTLLAARQLFPFEMRNAREATAPSWRGSHVSPNDLAIGFRVFASLLESGLPLSRAIVVFEDLAPAAWQASLSFARNEITSGVGLSEALARSPMRIPETALGMVAAGEAGGRLVEGVRAAADFTERTAAAVNAVRSALAYPILLCVVGGLAVVLLCGVVIPRFADILSDLGQNIPRSTQFVLATAAMLRQRAALIGSTLLGGALLFVAWTSTVRGRERWHATLLELPVIGGVRWSGASARFCAALESLLASGLPLAPAVIHAARASGDLAVERRVLASRELIVAGHRVADALDTSQALPTATVKLIRAGEESGQLRAMLAYAGRLDSDRAQRILAGAIRLLEPALILGFAGVVTLVAAALLQAMYSIRPT